MKNRTLVRELFASSQDFGGKTIKVAGWARTIRDSKAFGFIELNDGTYFKNLQVVFERENLTEIPQETLIFRGVETTITLTPYERKRFAKVIVSFRALKTANPYSILFFPFC